MRWLRYCYRQLEELFVYKENLVDNMSYDWYWKRVGFRHIPSVPPGYEVLSQFIEPGSSVLDVGCGDGLLLKFLQETQDCRVFGIDVSSVALDYARRRGVPCERADVTSSDFELADIYDYIVLREVVEHLAYPEALVCKLKGHFRRNLILSVPNIGYFLHRIRLMFGKFPNHWVMHPAEHLRHWTLADFRWWVASGLPQGVSYKVEHLIPYTGVPVLRTLWPNLFAICSVVVLS